MITTRRSFIMKTALGVTGFGLTNVSKAFSPVRERNNPIVVSTLKYGIQANETAWGIIAKNGYALDAVEEGLRVIESDAVLLSIENGMFPDARGRLTLDACIIDEKGNAGSVAFLQCIKHPVSVARLVMEKTPYVQLSGKGALTFALDNGFKKEMLLSKEQRNQWRQQKKEREKLNTDSFDDKQLTNGNPSMSMLALDADGRLCGASTGGGIPFQVHGRVGASAVTGAGLFIDGKVGGAAATGSGELLMKNLGAFMVVEYIRNGLSPEEACEKTISRILDTISGYHEHQIGFIAINASGDIGAASLHPGFNLAVRSQSINELREAGSWYKKL
jgi:N4-(beta-N-acetylglucosaminyl)-L-asparaginase